MVNKSGSILIFILVYILVLNVPDGFSHDKKQNKKQINQHDIELIKLNTGNAQSFIGLGVSSNGDKAYLSTGDKGITIVSLLDKKIEITENNYDEKSGGNFYNLGVHIRDNRLYTTMNGSSTNSGGARSSVLQVFDLTTQKLIRNYEIQEDKDNRRAHYFYHIAVDSKGVAYITSVHESAVYWVDTRDPDAHLQELVLHNDLRLIHGIDIAPDDSKLFITSYQAGLGTIDLKSGKLTFFYDEKARQSVFRGNDGIKYHDGVIYAVGHNALRKYTLSQSEESIIHSEVLLLNHALFNNPRVLEIANGWIYMVTNRDFLPVDFGSKSKGIGKQQNDTHILKYKL